MSAQDILQKRASVIQKMHSLIDSAENQGRDFTDSEQSNYDAWNKEQQGLKARADRLDGIEAVESDAEKVRGSVSLPSPSGRHRDPANTWRAADGSSASVYASDQKIFTGNNGGMSVGSAMRDLVIGARNQEVRNALSEGTDSAGGYTVPTHLLAQLIDLMRNKMRVIQAGGTTVMLETDSTSIARLASDPVCAWRNENAAVAESDPTFENVSFTARSLAVLVKVSRELLEDSLNVEQALMHALAQSLALEWDRVALYGSGSAPEPKGVYNDSNILEVDMGTNGAVIANHNAILSAAQKLSTNNSAPPTAAIMHPRTFYTQAGFYDGDGQPLNRPAVLAPLPYLETTQVPIDETHGTATDASNVIVGDFTQLMLGLRSAMRIEILNQPFAGNLQTGFLCHMRGDIAVAQPKAFCKITGVIPT